MDHWMTSGKEVMEFSDRQTIQSALRAKGEKRNNAVGRVRCSSCWRKYKDNRHVKEEKWAT